MSMPFGSGGVEVFRAKMRRVFLDQASMSVWLNTPHPQLKGNTPAQVLALGSWAGADLVLELVDSMPAAKVVVTEIRP